MRLEVRITVGTNRGHVAVDDVAVQHLLMALGGRALTLRGPGGRRLEVVAIRPDPRPSSSSAFIAVVEFPEMPDVLAS